MRIHAIADAAIGDDAAVWRRSTLRFRFQLGEWTFAARRLPVALYDTHFLRLGPLDRLALPHGRFEDCACYVVLSQPAPLPLPLVSWHAGALRYAPHQYEHAVVVFEGDFERYLRAQFPGDRRKKLLYQVRRLCRVVGSSAPMREYRGEAGLRAFFRLAAPLSRRTYQARLLGRGLVHEPVDEWARLGAADRARGWLLFDGARPIAFIAGRARGDVFEDEHIGFDPDYAALGPGNVLQYFVLEQLFAEQRYRVWDFGEGEGLHKSRFANLRVPCADLYYFPARAAPLALFGAQAGLHVASRAAVTALERLRLKTHVKRLLRRRAADG